MSHRYANHTTKKAPRQKRAIALYGEGEWRGKWFKCWKCGFINNIDRNHVADASSGGITSEVVESESSPPTTFGTEDERYIQLSSRITGATGFVKATLMQLDANGQVIMPHVSRQPKAVAGCSFCGSLNYH